MDNTTHLAEFTIVPANKDQVFEARKRQLTTWSRGMTEEQFFNRELQLEKLEHAVDNKLTCWVLVPRDNLGTLDFKCACETYRRLALVVKPTGSPKEVTAYGIASVFCPPKYRNKGYASHMMRLLHHVLSPPDSLPPFPREWGAPPPVHPDLGGDAHLSALYSDVGGDFYKKCGPSPRLSGWLVHSPISTSWRLQPGDVTNSGKFHLLSAEECKALWDVDAAYINDTLSNLPPSSHTRFTFLPHRGVAAFLLHRAIAEATLHPEYPRPLQYWGVSIPQENGSPPTYATWTLDMALSAPPVLVLTRLRATRESFPALIEALMTAARDCSAETIEVWNLDRNLLDIAANLGGTTRTREDHLPAVAWYGPERPDEIEWLFNEKFPWC